MSSVLRLGAQHTRAAALCLVVAAGIVPVATLQPGDAAAAANQPAADVGAADARVAASASVSTLVRRARAKLSAAKVYLERRRYTKALASLTGLRYNTRRAHRAGMALIGKPPQDPESDEPPGPGAVISVLRLEHRVTMDLVPFFNGLTRASAVYWLRYTLWLTHTLRLRMLNKVIALPEEKRSDYDDSMSDTVGIYPAEIRLVRKALNQYQLSANGRTGLTAALARIKKTNAKVQKVWGGGE